MHRRAPASRVVRTIPAAVALLLASACTRPPQTTRPEPGPLATEVARQLLNDLDSLVAAVERLDAAAGVATRDSIAPLRERFVAARDVYKRVEHLVEHFSPGTADGINGPALDDMAEDDPNRIVRPPEGFQVVEEYLYPDGALDDCAPLQLEVKLLLANVRRARYTAAATPLFDATILDAVRLQVVRLVALGLAGFDSPVALRGLDEGVVTLQALGRVLSVYRPALEELDAPLADTLFNRLAQAEVALRHGITGGFDAFDRLDFIVGHANPIGALLLRAQHTLGIADSPMRRAWRPSTESPFVAGAFDPLFFAPAPQHEPGKEEVALGAALFFDPVLSRGERRSCASCHQPEHAFADTLRFSVREVSDSGAVRRNTPTVLNSALQGATFADLRTSFLEDQVADVVRNADEMHGSLEEAAAAVATRPHYRLAFGNAFGAPPDSAVTPNRVRRALAAYLRSLEALDARFDRYVRGDRSAMNVTEREGFTVFMGKGKCGTCHFVPLFNGVVPPLYLKTESEVLGVPARAVVRGARVDPDSGRARITRLPIHLHAFKTPTLRNVAVTPPYMHNGVYRTLEEVVDFYDRGGGAGIGSALPNQTLPPDPLQLTGREKAALVAFLHTLTDTTSVAGAARGAAIAGTANAATGTR